MLFLPQAYLNKVNVERRDRAQSLAESKGVTMGQVAIGYVLAQEYNSFVLVGTTKIKNWMSNVQAAALDLSRAEVEYLRTGIALQQ